MDLKCCGGEEAILTAKGECEERTQGKAQGDYFPKTTAGKMRKSDFCELLQSAGLKILSFKGQWAWLW